MKAARGNPGGLFVARPGSPNRQWHSTKAIEARPHFLYYRLNTRLQEDSPMRLDDLFRNLGYLAATIGSQVRDCAFEGNTLESAIAHLRTNRGREVAEVPEQIIEAHRRILLQPCVKTVIQEVRARLNRLRRVPLAIGRPRSRDEKAARVAPGGLHPTVTS